MCEELWTREDPNGTKSVLDLVIVNENMVKCIKKMTIDEEHIYKLSSIRKVNDKYQETKSDHNTILDRGSQKRKTMQGE